MALLVDTCRLHSVRSISLNQPSRVDADTPSSRRIRRRFLTALLPLSVLTLLAPAVLFQTPLRNLILAAAVPGTSISATAESASGGWFEAIEFRGIDLHSRDGGLICTARRFTTTHGLLHYLINAADFGTLTLTEASLVVRIDENGEWPEFTSGTPSQSFGRFMVEDSSLRLEVASRDVPLIDFPRINLAGEITWTPGNGQQLRISPCVLMDHEPLSDLDQQQNLVLIAPLLSQAAGIHGSASISLETIEFSLDDEAADPFPIRGTATIHDLYAAADDNLLNRTRSLAGLLGLQMDDIPQLTMARNSTISFSISELGFVHESCAFLMPEISHGLQIRSSGILGMDGSLNLGLEVDLSAIGRDLSFLFPNSRIPLQVTGTVDDPEFRMAGGFPALPNFGGFPDNGADNQNADPQSLFQQQRGDGAGGELLKTLGSLLDFRSRGQKKNPTAAEPADTDQDK